MRRREGNRYRGAEIHNELLHDESVAFAVDVEFPESEHLRSWPSSSFLGDVGSVR